jgi:hypothetical protein
MMQPPDMTQPPDADDGMDPQQAADILQAAGSRARRQLTVSEPPMLLAWGVIYFVIYGVLWLSVRDQRPYQGPTQGALGIITVLATVSVIVTFAVVGRAAAGVGGQSAAQRRLYYLALPVAIVGVYTLEAALDHAGASRALLSIYGASAPLLVVGVTYMVGAGIWLNWTAFGLGVWLIATAAGSAFASPWTIWAVDALAVAAGFLLASAVSRRFRRS